MSESASGEAEYDNRHVVKNSLRDKPDELWRLRWEEGKSTAEIANQVGVSRASVNCWLRKYGINGRSHPWLDDDTWLFLRYFNDDMSANQIANAIGHTHNTVIKRIDEKGWSSFLQRNNICWLRYAAPTLKEMYLEKDMTTHETANELGFAQETICHYLKRFGINLRHGSEGGEKHPNWDGGDIYYYGPNWQEQRSKARERDNYTCQSCGIKESEYEKELAVHHITRMRDFKTESGFDYEQANDLDNLVTLCSSCHSRWEGIPLRPQYNE
jgi:transposase